MRRREKINAYRCEGDIIQNLKDAGCDKATVEAFIEALHSGKQGAEMKLLERHRRCLLEDLHGSQKRIDCLDYLIFTLERQNKE